MPGLTPSQTAKLDTVLVDPNSPGGAPATPPPEQDNSMFVDNLPQYKPTAPTTPDPLVQRIEQRRAVAPDGAWTAISNLAKEHDKTIAETQPPTPKPSEEGFQIGVTPTGNDDENPSPELIAARDKAIAQQYATPAAKAQAAAVDRVQAEKARIQGTPTPAAAPIPLESLPQGDPSQPLFTSGGGENELNKDLLASEIDSATDSLTTPAAPIPIHPEATNTVDSVKPAASHEPLPLEKTIGMERAPRNEMEIRRNELRQKGFSEDLVLHMTQPSTDALKPAVNPAEFVAGPLAIGLASGVKAMGFAALSLPLDMAALPIIDDASDKSALAGFALGLGFGVTNAMIVRDVGRNIMFAKDMASKFKVSEPGEIPKSWFKPGPDVWGRGEAPMAPTSVPTISATPATEAASYGPSPLFAQVNKIVQAHTPEPVPTIEHILETPQALETVAVPEVVAPPAPKARQVQQANLAAQRAANPPQTVPVTATTAPVEPTPVSQPPEPIPTIQEVDPEAARIADNIMSGRIEDPATKAVVVESLNLQLSSGQLEPAVAEQALQVKAQLEAEIATGEVDPPTYAPYSETSDGASTALLERAVREKVELDFYTPVTRDVTMDASNAYELTINKPVPYTIAERRSMLASWKQDPYNIDKMPPPVRADYDTAINAAITNDGIVSGADHLKRQLSVIDSLIKGYGPYIDSEVTAQMGNVLPESIKGQVRRFTEGGNRTDNPMFMNTPEGGGIQTVKDSPEVIAQKQEATRLLTANVKRAYEEHLAAMAPTEQAVFLADPVKVKELKQRLWTTAQNAGTPYLADIGMAPAAKGSTTGLEKIDYHDWDPAEHLVHGNILTSLQFKTPSKLFDEVQVSISNQGNKSNYFNYDTPMGLPEIDKGIESLMATYGKVQWLDDAGNPRPKLPNGRYDKNIKVRPLVPRAARFKDAIFEWKDGDKVMRGLTLNEDAYVQAGNLVGWSDAALQPFNKQYTPKGSNISQMIASSPEEIAKQKADYHAKELLSSVPQFDKKGRIAIDPLNKKPIVDNFFKQQARTTDETAIDPSYYPLKGGREEYDAQRLKFIGQRLGVDTKKLDAYTARKAALIAAGKPVPIELNASITQATKNLSYAAKTEIERVLVVDDLLQGDIRRLTGTPYEQKARDTYTRFKDRLAGTDRLGEQNEVTRAAERIRGIQEYTNFVSGPLVGDEVQFGIRQMALESGYSVEEAQKLLDFEAKFSRDFEINQEAEALQSLTGASFEQALPQVIEKRILADTEILVSQHGMHPADAAELAAQNYHEYVYSKESQLPVTEDGEIDQKALNDGLSTSDKVGTGMHTIENPEGTVPTSGDRFTGKAQVNLEARGTQDVRAMRKQIQAAESHIGRVAEASYVPGMPDKAGSLNLWKINSADDVANMVGVFDQPIRMVPGLSRTKLGRKYADNLDMAIGDVFLPKDMNVAKHLALTPSPMLPAAKVNAIGHVLNDTLAQLGRYGQALEHKPVGITAIAFDKTRYVARALQEMLTDGQVSPRTANVLENMNLMGANDDELMDRVIGLTDKLYFMGEAGPETQVTRTMAELFNRLEDTASRSKFIKQINDADVKEGYLESISTGKKNIDNLIEKLRTVC
jgi:hypothetical protein